MNRQSGHIGELARSLTYQEFPQHMTWDTSNKKWSARKDGFALGRMYFVSPTEGERFYLRTLLTVVKGPRSYDDLLTFNGHHHNSFREACIARGLLEDDGEWHLCLEEAAQMQTGARLRHLFVMLLLFCEPAKPELLWDRFREDICSDLGHHLSRMGRTNIAQDEIYDYGLFLINKTLKTSGSSLTDFRSMPQPIYPSPWDPLFTNNLIAEQLNYNRDFEQESALRCVESLNPEQRTAYDCVIQSVEQNLGRTFFLDGPGGTGKTYVYITLCHHLRSQRKVVLCVASSGIAALLLPGGRTAHSMFKIPISGLDDTSFCNIAKDSQRAALLRIVDLFIWDESLMQHRNAPEALDRSLRDICDCARPFGGKTIVFGGDFQQTLPVIPKGSQEDIVAASLPKSYIWGHIQTLRLRRNMRLESAHAEEVDFANWLLDVGHGRGIADNGTIPLRANMACPDIENLINYVYPQISGPTPPPQYFLDRIILAARNNDVTDLNNTILDRLQGEKTTLYSADKVVTERGADPVDDAIPLEYLNTLEATGLPPGNLHLKIGCPLILLRNLAPSRGLCNGTRMILLRVSRRVLQVRIMGGDYDGNVELIPRISLTPTSTCAEFAFSLRRRQFPVRLAFAISINKAQGQSVKYVGLDLRVPVFSHGQLYVALSRATSSDRVKVLLPARTASLRTTNVVYPEIFQSYDTQAL